MRQIFTFIAALTEVALLLLASAQVRAEASRTVFFDASGCGWIAGDVGIFRTQDAGKSWETLNDRLLQALNEGLSATASTPMAHFVQISDASFPDCKCAWVTTVGHRVLKTSDQGEHWDEVTPKHRDVSREQFVQVIAIDQGHAFLTTRQRLFRTSDGGRAWETFELGPEWLINPMTGSLMQFIDPQHGWYLENDPPPRFWATQDGGRTWDKVRHSVLKAASVRTFIVALKFISPAEGYLALDDSGPAFAPRFYWTDDGGQTWTPLRADLSKIQPHPGGMSQRLTAIPGGGILVSCGLSTTYRIGMPLPTKLLLALDNKSPEPRVLYKAPATDLIPFFVSRQRGWLVLFRGASEFEVLNTSDAGSDWRLLAMVKVSK